MKKFTAFVMGLCVALSAPALCQTSDDAAAGKRAAQVKIVRAAFGVFNSPESGEPGFVPTNVVPYRANQAYGWVMLIQTNQPQVKWREEFTLPEAPSTWGPAEQHGKRYMSDDGRTTVTERVVTPVRGTIAHSWSIAPGDPKGRYVMRVSIEDGTQQVFEFELR